MMHSRGFWGMNRNILKRFPSNENDVLGVCTNLFNNVHINEAYKTIYGKRGHHKNSSTNHCGYTEGNELDKLGREK
jgi:hypothetical protein